MADFFTAEPAFQRIMTKAKSKCLLACALFARLGFAAVPAGVLGLSAQGYESIDAVIPFDSQEVLGDTIRLPSANAAKLLFWDAGIQAFLTVVVSNGIWLSENGDPSPLAEANPSVGRSFRLQNHDSDPISVFVFGAIPSATSATIPIAHGMNHIGSPFPFPIEAPSNSLSVCGADFASGDMLSRWEPSAMSYGTDPTSPIQPGDAFWFFRAATNGFSWSIQSPVPSLSEGDFPCIENISVDPDLRMVSLTILPGETDYLDVLALDNPTADDLLDGWVRITRLESRSTNAFVWGEGLPVTNRFVRLYAVTGDSGPAADILDAGLLASFHILDEDVQDIPDLSTRTPELQQIVPNISYPKSNAPWHGLDVRFVDHFAARFEGLLSIPEDGVYAFHLSSDDGSCLFIDGIRVTGNARPHAFSATTGSIRLSEGLHDIRIDYYENAEMAGLVLEWTTPAGVRETIPAKSFRHVRPENIPPSASLSIEDGPFVLGNEVPVSVSASDPDGDALHIDLLANGVPFASVADSSFETVWLSDTTGCVSIVAIATDSFGSTVTSAVSTVEVVPCPDGFSPGIQASYFRLPPSPSRLPDFSVLTAAVVRIEQTIDKESTPDPWPGLDFDDDFAAIFDGYLHVPEAGIYRFELRSDDGSIVYLDDEAIISDDFLHGLRYRSAEIPLSKGFHPLRIEYFECSENAGLYLTWARSGDAKVPIHRRHLFHPNAPVDSDSDGMPDWWEKEWSFDPFDPSDASLDVDFDGLSNLEEFHFGTNPRLSDTDGDGMPDAWECAMGTEPFLADGTTDADLDGLSNLEEYHAGSNPFIANTDGDGLTDYEEWYGTGTDASIFDFSPEWQTLLPIPATNAIVRSGTWSFVGGSALSHTRGTIEFPVLMIEPDTPFLRITASHIQISDDAPVADSTISRFHAFYGDEPLGMVRFSQTPGDDPATIRIPLPHLSSGGHRIRLTWDGSSLDQGICLHEVALETPSGPDEDGDGLADWIVRKSLREDTVLSPTSSHFSPVCLEGTASHPQRVCLFVGTNSVSARPTANRSWYANIPLEPGSNPVRLAFENGLRTNSFNLTWAPFDVRSDSRMFSARTGDSILLTSPIDATVSVSRNGSFVQTVSLSPSGQEILHFPDAGSWNLSVSSAGLSRPVIHTVSVLGGGFPDENPAIVLGKSREWPCPDLPLSAIVQTDPSVLLSRSGDTLSIATDNILEPHWIVARTDPDGPVLDTVRMAVCWTRASPDKTAHRVEALDGYEIWEDRLFVFGVPEDVEIRSSIVVGGVVFDDCTILKTLFGSGPSSASEISLRFLHPDGESVSFCHEVLLYQNGIFIGETYQGNSSLPESLQ